MFNLRFPVNFNSPYKAESVIDYWQRWHITLTGFLTTYLYTPLTLGIMRRRRAHGRRVDRAAQRTAGGFGCMIGVPLLVTMGLAGIWHGSGRTFLVFGLLHALFLTINHAWRLLRPGVRSRAAPAIASRVALTYLAVLAASVVFRAPSLQNAGNVLAGMAGLHGFGAWSLSVQVQSVGGPSHLLWLVALYGIVWLLPNSQQIMQRRDFAAGDRASPAPGGPAGGYSLASSLALGAGAAIAVVAFGGTGEFLYFQF
jgi:alginate O-acetyltransferase complex protein AlgI